MTYIHTHSPAISFDNYHQNLEEWRLKKDALIQAQIDKVALKNELSSFNISPEILVKINKIIDDFITNFSVPNYFNKKIILRFLKQSKYQISFAKEAMLTKLLSLEVICEDEKIKILKNVLKFEDHIHYKQQILLNRHKITKYVAKDIFGVSISQLDNRILKNILTKLPELKYLDLSGAYKITKKAFKKGHHHLETLMLTGTAVTKRQIKKLNCFPHLNLVVNEFPIKLLNYSDLIRTSHKEMWSKLKKELPNSLITDFAVVEGILEEFVQNPDHDSFEVVAMLYLKLDSEDQKNLISQLLLFIKNCKIEDLLEPGQVFEKIINFLNAIESDEQKQLVYHYFSKHLICLKNDVKNFDQVFFKKTNIILSLIDKKYFHFTLEDLMGFINLLENNLGLSAYINYVEFINFFIEMTHFTSYMESDEVYLEVKLCNLIHTINAKLQTYKLNITENCLLLLSSLFLIPFKSEKTRYKVLKRISKLSFDYPHMNCSLAKVLTGSLTLDDFSKKQKQQKFVFRLIQYSGIFTPNLSQDLKKRFFTHLIQGHYGGKNEEWREALLSLSKDANLPKEWVNEIEIEIALHRYPFIKDISSG